MSEMSSERNKQMLFPVFGGLLFALAFLFFQISEDGDLPQGSTAFRG